MRAEHQCRAFRAVDGGDQLVGELIGQRSGCGHRPLGEQIVVGKGWLIPVIQRDGDVDGSFRLRGGLQHGLGKRPWHVGGGERFMRELGQRVGEHPGVDISEHGLLPDRPADLEAEECSFAESRPLTEEIYRRDALTPDLNPRFVDQHESWERSIGARRFVARIDGALAGECDLYIDGADAQVEFVDTLEEFRGRGVARAVVLGAAEAARASGADRVFILADENDWPKELYRRLGFDPMARRWEVQRYP